MPAAKPTTARKTKAVGKGVRAKKPAVSPFRQWADRKGDTAIEELCQHIVQGGHLNAFVQQKGFAYVTTLDWIKRDERRSEMYARAREDRADVLADQIVAIADEENTMVKGGEDGETPVSVVFDPTAVARNKLRVDARKWVAAKMKPRVYGDRQQVDLNDITPKTQDQVDAELMKLLSKVRGNAA